MTEQDARSHAEKLRTEQRTCLRCGYVIANPMTDRCPRCFEPVAREEANCGSCTWQGNCEFAHIVHEAKKKKS